MKKNLVNLMVVIIAATSFSSCATVLGGKVTQAQRTKPKEGEPARKVRTVALIADILIFPPLVVVDFATGAIYKPQKEKSSDHTHGGVGQTQEIQTANPSNK
ncbi:MAG: hypothetical protein J7577_12190 [Sphingobacteriaceae bacterium]|nr:hypothetical protein [Sphingobacteriaceae bacterium]